jgi:hypothetical protein
MGDFVPRKEFAGFSYPDDGGFTRFPNDWFDVCAEIENLAELKIMLYLARHTWGYQEYDSWKRISVDEFMHGRKRKDGTRMDSGTGLSEMSVRHGLKKAIVHGYVVCGYNNHDLARIDKYYYLKMRKSDNEV